LELGGKRILVTGCTGFLGSHLVNNLAEKKEMRIRGLVKGRFESLRRINMPVELVFGNMLSFESMMKATRDCDVVVHCAIGSPEETDMGTKNVIEAARRNNIKKFIYISSSAVFGLSPSDRSVKDERIRNRGLSTNFLTAYSRSKIESERIVFSYNDSYGFPIVVLRPTNIYGPGSFWWTNRPFLMLQNNCYVLVDGGSTPSNVVYVDDVLNAIELAIQKECAVG
jgi:nucleoside-diphosphate-sugar epimerase